MPRVTKIIDVVRNPGLEAWRRRVGDEEAERIGLESMAHGTLVHNHCEMLLRGENLMMVLARAGAAGASQAAIHSITAFAGWIRETKPKVLEIEKLVWAQMDMELPSGTLDWAGTLDFMVDIDGVQWIYDLKTNKNHSPSFALQLAAYGMALHEMNEWDGNVSVIRIPNDSPNRVIERRFTQDELKEAGLTFTICVELYQWRERHKNDWKTG